MKTFEQVCYAYQHSKSEVLNQTEVITEAAWTAASGGYALIEYWIDYRLHPLTMLELKCQGFKVVDLGMHEIEKNKRGIKVHGWNKQLTD